MKVLYILYFALIIFVLSSCDEATIISEDAAQIESWGADEQGGLIFYDSDGNQLWVIDGGSVDPQDQENVNNCEQHPVVVYYQSAINDGPGCGPCAACAMLAFSICMGNQVMIDNWIEAVQNEAEGFGEDFCPELYDGAF